MHCNKFIKVFCFNCESNEFNCTDCDSFECRGFRSGDIINSYSDYGSIEYLEYEKKLFRYFPKSKYDEIVNEQSYVYF